MRFIRLALLALPILAFAAPAYADEEGEDRATSHFTVAFGGGALLPFGEMDPSTEAGLNVTGRIGWNAANGLGLVTNLEYAPLRRESDAALTDVDSHMFVATAAPRFTLGRKVLRLWVAAGGGVVVERVRTETTSADGILTDTEVDTVPAFNGSSGIDLHFFSNGGLSIAGAYTRSFSDTEVYDYFSVNAGLVFTL